MAQLPLLLPPSLLSLPLTPTALPFTAAEKVYSCWLEGLALPGTGPSKDLWPVVPCLKLLTAADSLPPNSTTVQLFRREDGVHLKVGATWVYNPRRACVHV